MKIHWEVIKKRGNLRPVLRYGLELEPFEIDLAVPQVIVETAISRPPNAWRSYCYPGQDERSSMDLGWYRLVTPSHKQGKLSESLMLSWRDPGNRFVDVRAAFERLRHNFELTLRNACDSAPVEIKEHLELTEDTRRHVACGVAASRFLSAVGF
jgi:hypothetical protein